MRLFFRSVVASAALLTGVSAAAANGPAFERQPDIAAPDGHWDFASWDAGHRRVIVAHGKDALLIDPADPAALRKIGELDGAHAALAIPGGDDLLISSGHDNTVRILDMMSGAQLASIPVVGDPDATVLSTDGRTAYVMGGDSGAISIIDLDRRVETARLTIKPGLEVPVLFGQHMLAVNDEDLGEIELVDLVKGKMTGTIPMPGCKGPTGLAYAPRYGLALSSCANGKAALVDLRRRRVVKMVPIGLGPDTAIWDAARRHFLVPCGKSGSLSVIALGKHGPRRVATVPTELSARTAALDPVTGRLYLPAARFAPAPAGKRPDIIPGSFHIVVLAPRGRGS